MIIAGPFYIEIWAFVSNVIGYNLVRLIDLLRSTHFC